MLVCLYTFILFKCCRCLMNSTSSFVIGSNTLTERITQLAVGYDSSIDAILLYGGYNHPQQFTLFKNGNFLYGGRYFLFNSTRGYSQHYTQLNHELWMIRYHGGGFISVNTQTHAVRDPLIVIPTNVNYGACLTSTENHLIVIGSGILSSSNPPTNIVQIYRINDGVWLDNVPSLKDNRCALSCAVVNDKVYAIGGWGYDPTTFYHTIEVLDISNIVSASFTSWYYFSGSLRTGRRETRSVVYGTNIYVIGGEDESGPYPKDINMLNTVTGECNVVDYLAYGVESGAAIVIGNILYVFAGYRNPTTENRYQYTMLPTLNNTTLSPTTSNETLLSTNEGESEATEPGADTTLTIAIVSSIMVFICFVLLFVAYRFGKRAAEHHMDDVNVQVDGGAPLNMYDERASVKVVDEGDNKGHGKTASFVIRSDSEQVPGKLYTSGRGEKEYGAQESIKEEGDGNNDEDADEEVRVWLDSIGYVHYYDAFVTNGFNSMDMVKEINDTKDLDGIVDKRAHQIKISNQIQKLKQ